MRPEHTKRPRIGRGFTLVELLIVMVIIGIILAFILSASFEGLKRAEERKTQALIAKIEAGLADRFDAVYGTQLTANDAHSYLAAIWSSSFTAQNQPPCIPSDLLSPPPNLQWRVRASQRAQTIARLDYLKAELPDVFYLQLNDTHYPFNFAAIQFPPTAGTAINTGPLAPYYYAMLPFGIGVLNDPNGLSGSTSYGANPANGYQPPTAVAPNPKTTPETTGIFGASYTAMGGLTKQLVDAAILSGISAPTPSKNIGYDGVDNSGNGLVDEIQENGPAIANYITGTLLPNHTHNTARSEMLYALLVEGQGPYGSVFSPDDFNDSEVMDTDGDGLLEFVDAWKQPLQFYRWPIGYVSDIADLSSANQGASLPFASQQRGLMPYTNVFSNREQNPLDPGQTLLDPSWWSGVPITPNAVSNNNSPFAASAPPLSGSANWFQSHFFALTDPNVPYYLNHNPQVGVGAWDRGAPNSSYYGRRAYYSKFLVLSGGPDKTPGVPVMGAVNPAYIQIESQAAPATLARDTSPSNVPYLSFLDNNNQPIFFPPPDPATQTLIEAGKDDISNHNVMAPGGSTQ